MRCSATLLLGVLLLHPIADAIGFHRLPFTHRFHAGVCVCARLYLRHSFANLGVCPTSLAKDESGARIAGSGDADAEAVGGATIQETESISSSDDEDEGDSGDDDYSAEEDIEI